LGYIERKAGEVIDLRRRWPPAGSPALNEMKIRFFP
jgi:hypothetical protein